MIDALNWLWPLVDAPDSPVAAHVVARWPAGVHQRLVQLGFLRPAAEASRVSCPECGEHLEEVLASEGPGGQVRLSVPCPMVLRADVPPAARQQWTVDHSTLAASLAKCLALVGKCTAIVPGRLWRLGRTTWPPGGKQTREVVLALRMREQDAPAVAAHVGPGGRAIVLVPQRAPDDRTWPGRVPAVAALSQVATVEGDDLVVDALMLWNMVTEADRVSSEQSGASLDAVSAKKVRRHVKATIQSMLSDEALVQAYRIHGSYRKTADALNAEGHITDRWAVERAVKAAGGPKAVRKGSDSASVARTVASHSRDRAKKVLEYR